MFTLKRPINLLKIINSAIGKSEVRPVKVRLFPSNFNNFYATTVNCDKKNENFASRLVSGAPRPIQPYLKLIRLDKPAGIWLIFWPSAIGIASAAPPASLPDLYMLSLFFTGALTMRGAGCTINDMWDRNIDAQVSRTKDRPLASGEITMKQAWVFLAAQLSTALVILLQLNWYSILLGGSSLVFVIVYPLMKRFTYWPQVMLGLTFNWGMLLGHSAVKGYVDLLTSLPMFLSCVCWTMFYDTIYAHQDKVDDRRVGVKSTALKFDKDTKLWLGGFGGLMMSGFVTAGIINELAWPYYAAVSLVGTHIISQLATLDIDNPSDCANKFVSNSNIGLLLFCGFVLGNLFKSKKEPKDKLIPLVA